MILLLVLGGGYIILYILLSIIKIYFKENFKDPTGALYFEWEFFWGGVYLPPLCGYRPGKMSGGDGSSNRPHLPGVDTGFTPLGSCHGFVLDRCCPPPPKSSVPV